MSAGPASGSDPFSKLDALFEGAVQRQEWQQAVQVRAQTASLARLHGRMDSAHRYFQQAIDLASEHRLDRLELELRVQRFRQFLTTDLSGTLQAELAGELAWSIWPTMLRGNLIEKLEDRGGAAIAVCERLRSTESEPADRLEADLQLAKGKALAFSLVFLAGQFDDLRETLQKSGGSMDAALRERMSTIADQTRAEIEKICDSLRVDAFLLAAESEHKRGNFETRDELLDSAEKTGEGLAEKLVTVYMVRADYATGDTAIAYARRAVDESERVSAAILNAQATAKLNELLAQSNGREKPGDAPREGAGATEAVGQILNGLAYPALQAGRFEESLTQINRALEYASTPHLQRMVLRLRAVPLFELGRFEEAERDIDSSISLLSSELNADYRGATELFDERIPEEENLYLMKALLRAKAGDSAGAWSAAEQGRSGRLKREIVEERGFATNFEGLREWLRARRAAVVSFGPTRWGTLVLSAGPDDGEPQSRVLDCAAKDLFKNRALADDDAILGWAPELSSSLIHPLSERLQEITRGARVLYIVPDSALYSAPFAALTLAADQGGSMLIDLCPLAIAPSAAVLLWCVSRAGVTRPPDCLAVAIGESQGIQFRDDLPAIAAAPWPNPPTQLVDEEATPANVGKGAAQHSVLIFSCHGKLEQDKELMSASQLVLAGGSLSARDVLSWQIDADLVFLSACVAGRFRSAARTDVTGFVKAFMRAGARSLVAPLIHVDPEMARTIAAEFFTAWLGGATKAKALQIAQLRARAKYADNGWATFWLFWEFV